MIPLTPATSWLLLAALSACGVVAAITVARWLDARDEWRSIREWHETCDALDRWDEGYD